MRYDVNMYLHRYVVDYLKQYGRLADVVNEVLDLCWDEGITYDAPSRDGAARYAITLTSEAYHEAVTKYGYRHPYASPRRVLYYFTDMELGEELKFKVTFKGVITQQDVTVFDTSLDLLEQELTKLIECRMNGEIVAQAKTTVDDVVKLRRLLHDRTK